MHEISPSPQNDADPVEVAIFDPNLRNAYATKPACETRVTIKGKTGYVSELIEECLPEDEVLCIHTSRFIPHIQNYLVREGSETMSKSNIEKMLRNHPAFAGSVARFQVNKNEVSGHGLFLKLIQFEAPSFEF